MGGMPDIAPHIARMPGSGVRHILERALRRPDTIILAVGEPGEVAGAAVRDAAAAAWTAGAIRYTPNGGIPPLREAIRAKLAQQNGLRVDLELEPGAGEHLGDRFRGDTGREGSSGIGVENDVVATLRHVFRPGCPDQARR